MRPTRTLYSVARCLVHLNCIRLPHVRLFTVLHPDMLSHSIESNVFTKALSVLCQILSANDCVPF